MTGTLPLRSARGLESFFGEPIEDPGPWLVAEARPTDGAVVLSEGETPLLVAARRGQGAVFFVAFDPSLEPLRSWRGSANLWRYLIGYAPDQIQIPSNVVRQYAGWGRFPRNALSDLSPLRPPASESLPWILIVYGLTVGPASYLLLRRVGRLEWTLWVAPAADRGRGRGRLRGRAHLVRERRPVQQDHARARVRHGRGRLLAHLRRRRSRRARGATTSRSPGATRRPTASSRRSSTRSRPRPARRHPAPARSAPSAPTRRS